MIRIEAGATEQPLFSRGPSRSWHSSSISVQLHHYQDILVIQADQIIQGNGLYNQELHPNLYQGSHQTIVSLLFPGNNGSCYVSNDLKAHLNDISIKHIRGLIHHRKQKGKIERYHRLMKNVVKLNNYYTPKEIERAVADLVRYYNYHRYHESINNLPLLMFTTEKAIKLQKGGEKQNLQHLQKKTPVSKIKIYPITNQIIKKHALSL